MIYLKIDTFQCRHKIATGNIPLHLAQGCGIFSYIKGTSTFESSIALINTTHF
jgi:hypothetical protein